MDFVSVVIGGVVLVFTCLALYELFGRGENASGLTVDKAVESRDNNSDTKVVEKKLAADEAPPTQTGIHRVRSMLAATKSNKQEESKEATETPKANNEPTQTKEEELPDPFV